MKPICIFLLCIVPFVCLAQLPQIEEMYEANQYLLRKNPQKALAQARMGLALAKDAKLDWQQARFLEQIAISNYFLGRYEVALEYLEEAKNILFELNDEAFLAIVYNTIGNVYKIVGDYELAMKHYLESLRLKEMADDKTAVAITMNNIGLLYDNIGNYAEALRFHYLSLDIKEELGDQNGVAASFNNIGLVYEHMEQYEKALSFFNTYLSIKQENEDADGMARAFNNIGKIHFLKKDYVEAKKTYQKALELRSEESHPRSVAGILNNMADVHLAEKDFSQTEELLNRSVSITKKIDEKSIQKNSYYLFYELYLAQKWYDKALDYHLMYSALATELAEKKLPARIENLYQKYQEEKNEKIIQKEIHHQEVANLKLVITGIIALSIIGYGMLLWILWRKRK